MNTKITSLLAGVTLLVGVSVANAAEPLRLTEASMDTVTAAGTKKHDHHADWKHFDHKFFKGPKLAVATADASCKGATCLAVTDAQAHVTPWGAVASSVAVAFSAP
ncbi:hypothetical protein [Nitrosomonas sp. Nm166]|uniref:hypothetical protein n=1 Tax=Nitrosomonas sp. Nm166 TaxID=1881054 RepID=UPI0008E80BA3|nr:hypothetical protein [Nitrosomonas sp. Nm166]SFF15911.1 hypothetical protein SAMN05428977_10599 [Nitrosomonas sp. Nm166]